MKRKALAICLINIIFFHRVIIYFINMFEKEVTKSLNISMETIQGLLQQFK